LTFSAIKDIAARSDCLQLLPRFDEQIDMTVTFRSIFSLLNPKVPLEFFYFSATKLVYMDRKLAVSYSARWKAAVDVGKDLEGSVKVFDSQVTIAGF